MILYSGRWRTYLCVSIWECVITDVQVVWRCVCICGYGVVCLPICSVLGNHGYIWGMWRGTCVLSLCVQGTWQLG